VDGNPAAMLTLPKAIFDIFAFAKYGVDPMVV
jgi:hypothetical protein